MLAFDEELFNAAWMSTWGAGGLGQTCTYECNAIDAYLLLESGDGISSHGLSTARKDRARLGAVF